METKGKWYEVQYKPHVCIFWTGPGSYAPLYSVVLGKYQWFQQGFGEQIEYIPMEWIRTEPTKLASGVLN